MKIIYADDAPAALEEVKTYLVQYGHQTEAISTTNLLDFQSQIYSALQSGFVPEIIINGGHNVLRNGEDETLFNVEAFEIRNWLNQSELPVHCRFILYSRDTELVARAANREWGFDAGVLKGQPDSLARLLAAIEAGAAV